MRAEAWNARAKRIRIGADLVSEDTRTATLTIPLAQGLAFRDLRDALARSREATAKYRAANDATGTTGLGSDARVSEAVSVETAWQTLKAAKSEVRRALDVLVEELGGED